MVQYLVEIHFNKAIPFKVFTSKLDGNVIFPVTSGHPLGVDPLNQQSLGATFHLIEVFELVFQRNRSHHLAASALLAFGHLVGHCGGFSAGAFRIFKGVDVAESNLASEVATLPEGLFRLARKSHNDVGSEVEVGTEIFDALAHLFELSRRIETVHPF